MLSTEALASLSDLHAQANVPTRKIWELAEDRLDLEATRVAEKLRWTVRAREKHGFFETWSPFWFGNDLDIDRCERAATQIVCASAISVLDAIVDKRISADDDPLVDNLISIALRWSDQGEISPWIAAAYRNKLTRWCHSSHSIPEGAGCTSILLRKNPFYPLWGKAFGREAGVKSSAFALALGILDDSADIQEDFRANQTNAILTNIPRQCRDSLEAITYFCLSEDIIGRAVSKAVSILRSLSDSDQGLFGATCNSLISSLNGYSDFCRLRLVTPPDLLCSVNAIN
jgi:hypothetical protein